MTNNLLDLSFNLEAEAEAGAWLTLVHPKNGEDLPVQIKLAGKHSKTWRDAEDADINKRLQTQKKTGSQPDLDVAAVRARGIRLLAAVTLGWQTFDGEKWRDVIVHNGQELKCTASNARQFYHAETWVADQVDTFTSSPTNFGKTGDDAPSVNDAAALIADVEKK